MKLDELRDLAKRRLNTYRKDTEIVTEWETRSLELAGKVDNMGIRGSKTSDPTAQVATCRLEPPPYIKEAAAWVAAINDAWAEMQVDDELNGMLGCGKAYVMERYYGLTEPNALKYEQKKAEICENCSISDSTFGRWLAECVNAVMHFAERSGIAKGEQ